MNRILTLIGLVLVLLPLMGCQSDPRPGPGLAALVVKVNAVPKMGAPGVNVSGYDQSTDLGTGALERIDYANLQDIVVWAEPADHRFQAPAPAVAAGIDLTGKRESSDVTAVACVGQTLVVRNTGGVPLNTYCVSDGNNFNLGTIAAGGQAQTIVQSAGLIELLCESVAEPLARIYAAPTPWVSLAQSGATASFNNLPPGKYRIVSWHPRLPGTATDVTLLPDQVVHSSVEVGVNRLPKIDSR
jgi:hypothetical protein